MAAASDSKNVVRTSADGEEYAVLSTPAVIPLTGRGHSTHELPDGYRVHHIYVPCTEVRARLLPMDANPREPEKSAQFKAMQYTLQHAPKDFFKFNNGMTVICTKVEPARDGCVVSFSPNEGICNGGHTYFAIVRLGFEPDPDALVRLELIEMPTGLSQEERTKKVVEIATARNNNNRLTQQSEADYLQFYKDFKRCLADLRWVRWHEGDSKALPEFAVQSTHLIRMLAAMDPLRYFHPIYNDHADIHKTAATSVASIHNAWYQEMATWEEAKVGKRPMSHMAVLGNDILELRDRIAADLREGNLGPSVRRTNFFNFLAGKRKPADEPKLRKLLTDAGRDGLDVPTTVEVMLLGLFRTNVWMHPDPEDPENIPDFIGWYSDPQSLWEERRVHVLERLSEDFRDFHDEPVTFVRAKAPYKNDFLTFALPPVEPSPTIVYDVASQEKFEMVRNAKEATHFFDPHRAAPPIAMKPTATIPDGSLHYRKIA